MLQRLVTQLLRRGNAHLGTADSEPFVSHARSLISRRKTEPVRDGLSPGPRAE